jgi:methionyl-tRNA formyltransferase
MLRLGTGEGTLLIDTVQPAGGKPMSAADFLRGHEL